MISTNRSTALASGMTRSALVNNGQRPFHTTRVLAQEGICDIILFNTNQAQAWVQSSALVHGGCGVGAFHPDIYMDPSSLVQVRQAVPTAELEE
ncbi:hypothetical protein PoB_001243500 [Plakobranchus ocellatus]|uniref:Uncharacterized protein n=1 Tax=Plakobranchus ocellatus TaxID=259542 RepID=A0AAV3YU30_9GAST|nr:hypothetical protein PoB_001243500 [Plakobranchus ocellatus]